MVYYLLNIELLIDQDKSYGDADDEGCVFIVKQNKVTVQATNISLLKKIVQQVDRLVWRTILTIGPQPSHYIPITHIIHHQSLSPSSSLWS